MAPPSLEVAAARDALTGLPTHAGVSSYLGPGGSAFGVAFDIAALIMVTDFFGYGRSDEVLVTVSKTLHRVATSRAGQAFRIGGDEFLVLLPASDHEQAVAAARAGVRAVAELQLEYRHHQYPTRQRVEVNAVVCQVHASLPEHIKEVREWIAREIHLAKNGEWDRVGLIADSGRAMPT